MYEVFEHTADLGLRVRAPDLESLFRDAARALFSIIVEDLPDDDRDEVLPFELRADRLDWLLFDWLNELLYVFETRRLVLGRFRVRLDDFRLVAEARGRTMDPERHRMLHEVKAITYHGLRVERDRDGWLAEVIVDI